MLTSDRQAIERATVLQRDSKGLSTGAKTPTRKGKRLIVVYIGNENGFLEDWRWIFECKKLLITMKVWMVRQSFDEASTFEPKVTGSRPVHDAQSCSGLADLDWRSTSRTRYLSSLNATHGCPRASTFDAARRFGVSQSTVWKLLNAAGLHPYHFQPIQQLHDPDPVPRRALCDWLLSHPNANILWTDEALFTRVGLYNIHNEHCD
ncbi:hypothetical protein SFRURICE_003920 [Spodoptera frugiperda]|nr:hypothetical protein SFRURICE_003920 [Spodoptera frugiperda]